MEPLAHAGYVVTDTEKEIWNVYLPTLGPSHFLRVKPCLKTIRIMLNCNITYFFIECFVSRFWTEAPGELT